MVIFILLSNIQCYASEGKSYAKNYNQTVITGRFIMIQNSIIVILAMMILALSIALALLIRRYARFKNNYDKVIVRDKIRSDYIIIISHELRTPLNIIVNSAKLLKEYLSNNDKMDKQYVIDKSEYIVNNSSRLLKTINNSIDAAIFEAGLGMYITYNLIKIHGGDMTVESELNKGTTITISMPIRISDLEDNGFGRCDCNPQERAKIEFLDLYK